MFFILHETNPETLCMTHVYNYLALYVLTATRQFCKEIISIVCAN